MTQRSHWSKALPGGKAGAAAAPFKGPRPPEPTLERTMRGLAADCLPLEAVVGDIVRFPPYAGFALTLPVTLVWT
jgi:hypothetical protein